jgi:periplasmic divalent cation tolerance protein
MNDHASPVPSMLVVLCSCPPAQADSIARKLVERKLAACVNVTSPVHSIYFWRGKLEEDEERLLVIKTTPARWPELAQALAGLHPYEVPEIIALPVYAGAESYLRWVEESLCTD